MIDREEFFVNILCLRFNSFMRLSRDFYRRDVLEVAPALLGKTLVRKFDNGKEFKAIITETEAYCGERDLACHASKGRTSRTEVMYFPGGFVYVYLIYGMHWLLNVVTGEKDDPQAVLIRSVAGLEGPGRVGKILKIDKSFYGENLLESNRLWIEPGISAVTYTTTPRIGVDYAREWKHKPLRYVLL